MSRMIGRRGFIQSLVAATTAALAVEIDPERALWVPGAKSFFIPEQPAVKNLITDPAQVATEYKLIRSNLAHSNLSTGGRVVYTSIGAAEFDKDWNLLRLSGRPITSAREAADLMARHYTHHGNRPHGAAFERIVEQVAAKRAAAGLKDQIDTPGRRNDWTRHL